MNNKKVGIGLGILAIVVIFVVVLLSLFKSPTMYTVTFDLGNNLISETREVEKNSVVSKPNDPEKEGYTFEGWYYNGVLFDFSTEITSDIKLEAKWSSTTTQKWTVSFDSNGGSSVSNVEVVDGSVIATEPKPTRAGYTFLGWYLDGNLFNFNTKVTKNITLTAKWEKTSNSNPDTDVEKPVKYTVTFDSNGGSSVKSQTVTKDYKVTKPTDPTRDGYTFLGWYNGTAAFDFDTKITKNITLKAKWEKEAEDVVVSYKIEEVAGSLGNQAKLYIIVKEGNKAPVKVRGSINITSSSGKTITKTVEVTGLDITLGAYTYSNPKVLD